MRAAIVPAMRTHGRSRLLASTVAVVALGAIGIGAASAADPGASGAVAKKITPAGVGKVKLGMSYHQLRDQGLIGKIGPGCELGGPNTRSAKLLAPLKGAVDFTLSAPRKVTDIVVRGGAKARGVGIGDTIADIKAAYPKAKVNHATDDTFGVTLVAIPKGGGGKLRFAVDASARKITLVGVPLIAFCE